jgi:hypothetical protein
VRELLHQAKQQGAGSAWSPLVKVSSLVYASPTRISVDCKVRLSPHSGTRTHPQATVTHLEKPFYIYKFSY